MEKSLEKQLEFGFMKEVRKDARMVGIKEKINYLDFKGPGWYISLGVGTVLVFGGDIKDYLSSLFS